MKRKKIMIGEYGMGIVDNIDVFIQCKCGKEFKAKVSGPNNNGHYQTFSLEIAEKLTGVVLGVDECFMCSLIEEETSA